MTRQELIRKQIESKYVMTDRLLQMRFNWHGLGDVSHVIHLLELYKQRGYRIEIHQEHNKTPLWAMAGYPQVENSNFTDCVWGYRPGFNSPGEHDGSGNKIYGNINFHPFPDIGNRDELWEELKKINLKITPPQQFIDEVAEWLKPLPRPIILLHAKGSNDQQNKSMDDNIQRELYTTILEKYSLINLDWDNRTFNLSHTNYRHLKQTWGHIDLWRTAALFYLSDCLVGCDSGPFHMAQFFDLPQIFVGHNLYFSCVSLPREQATFFVRKHPMNQHRKDWNVVEYAGDRPTAQEIYDQIRNALLKRIIESKRMEVVPQGTPFQPRNIGREPRPCNCRQKDSA